ncbi:MAG TPA: IS66 family transposase [Polyangia bacterium]
MVSTVEKLNDPALVKQAALLLEQENARLHARLQELIAENAKLKGNDGPKQLQLEIVRLQEQMATLRQDMFGASSEKRKKDGESPAPRAPHNGHGPRQQTELPIEEHALELSEADRVCPDCGAILAEWEGQTEDSEEITVVERHFVVRKHRRKKYRCKHGCAPVTAPGPVKLVEGGRYSVEFAVYVAIAKYLYHLPLERQVRMYMANSLHIDSQTLWDQIQVLAKHLEPSYQALRGEVFASMLIHADETYWRMLSKGAGKKWYAWTVASPAAVFHKIFDSRSTAAAREVLDGYHGNVMADGYEPYQTVARAGPDGLARYTLAFCWAHVRRKFVKAEPFAPTCAEVIELIGKLYAIERELPDPHTLTGAEQEAALARIVAVRREQSEPVVEAIRAWAGQQQGLPESTFRKAIQYMLNLWHGLTVFIENPWVVLDNNFVERQIRPLVVGRKNHYGSKSKRGTEVAAIFYSLIETAQLRGEDPAVYLRRAAMAAIATPGTITLPTAAAE